MAPKGTSSNPDRVECFLPCLIFRDFIRARDMFFKRSKVQKDSTRLGFELVPFGAIRILIDKFH